MDDHGFYPPRVVGPGRQMKQMERMGLGRNECEERMRVLGELGPHGYPTPTLPAGGEGAWANVWWPRARRCGGWGKILRLAALRLRMT